MKLKLIGIEVNYVIEVFNKAMLGFLDKHAGRGSAA